MGIPRIPVTQLGHRIRMWSNFQLIYLFASLFHWYYIRKWSCISFPIWYWNVQNWRRHLVNTAIIDVKTETRFFQSGSFPSENSWRDEITMATISVQVVYGTHVVIPYKIICCHRHDETFSIKDLFSEIVAGNYSDMIVIPDKFHQHHVQASICTPKQTETKWRWKQG